MKKLSILLLLTTLSPFAISAQESNEVTQANEEKTMNYEDPTGVSLRFNPDGSMRAILAKGEAELVFGDRKDIRQALQKATLRAKASISKFLGEKMQSSEITEEITDTVMSSTPDNSTATRDSVTKHIEKISNDSEAILKGVVSLKQAIHKKDKYVEVTVGYKNQLVDIADKVRQKINGGQLQAPLPKNATDSNNKIEMNSTDEVRKSKMYDDF